MAEGALIIGAANFDIKGRMFHAPVITSSNSSAIRTSFGGVARNIAENLASWARLSRCLQPWAMTMRAKTSSTPPTMSVWMSLAHW